MFETVQSTPPSSVITKSNESPLEITSQLILTQLQKKVSLNNAKLILDSAKIQIGIRIDDKSPLNKEQAKALCLKLMNQGGPAFHVGQSIYKEYLI